MNIPNSIEASALSVLLLAPFAIIHLILSFGILRDSKRLRDAGMGLFMFGPIMWAFIGLFFGLFGVAAYWMIHHSTLRPLQPPGRR
jgi:multisubunit Na+/H+ antiporter MnhB subunit